MLYSPSDIGQGAKKEIQSIVARITSKTKANFFPVSENRESTSERGTARMGKT